MHVATNSGFEKIIRTRPLKVSPKCQKKGLASHRKGYTDKREYSALH